MRFRIFILAMTALLALVALPGTVLGARYVASLYYAPPYISIAHVPGGGMELLEVRLEPPFDTGESNIDNVAGLTQFSYLAPAGAAPPIDPLAFIPVRLLGCVGDLVTATLVYGQVVDVDGNLLDPGVAVTRTYQLGDAKVDGAISVADLLFISQYQVGLRNVGDDPGTEVNAVNAASVRHDTPYDLISTADLLFLAQYLVGLRDGCMNLVPAGSPPQR